MENKEQTNLEEIVRLYALQYGLFPNKEAKTNLDRYIQLIISAEDSKRQKSLKELYDSEKTKPLESKVDELMKLFNLVKIFRDKEGKLFSEDVMRKYIERSEDPARTSILELVFQRAYGKEYKATKSKTLI